MVDPFPQALDQPQDLRHLAAGQHVDVRVTAEDGYQAQRSYSIASAPEDTRLALTIEDGSFPLIAGAPTDASTARFQQELAAAWAALEVALGGPSHR